jgi:ADP-ribosylglycohydrolase
MLARGVAADGEWGEAVARSASEPTTAEHIRRACELAMEGAQPPFALLTLGTGGYVVESVASAVYLTMRFAPDDDFHGAVQAAVRAGDDTDTTAAITGALVGAACGLRAIPSALADGVEDGERLVALGQRLADIADGYLLGPEFGAV